MTLVITLPIAVPFVTAPKMSPSTLLFCLLLWFSPVVPQPETIIAAAINSTNDILFIIILADILCVQIYNKI
jgi:hypothetical protein